jgi:aspartate/methionine/tyrosine aminotransferase
VEPAERLAHIELSLIRQINALATPLSANLGLGEPNLVPDATFLELAGEASSAPWAYSPNAGFLSLRKLLAENTPFDPKTEICITAGTQEALFALFQAWVQPGDEVLIPNPGFVAYATLTNIVGAKAVTYDLDPPDWHLDPAAIEKRITRRTKLIVVNTPSNPLGAVATEAALRRLGELADEHDCLVVSDEVYREIWYEAEPPSMLGMGRNVIVANGMSKSHGMTGLRIGWLAGRSEIMAPIIKAHQYIATCASVFSQRLAELVLTNKAWNGDWLQRVREQFGRQREAALNAIQRELDTSIPPPAGAFYAFVPVPSCDTISFAKTLATDAAVLVIPGVAFGTAGEGFVRLSFAASVDAIGTGVERIGRHLTAAGR